MSHLDPELAALIAMGETDAADAQQLDHLAQCPECADEVAAFAAAAGAARGALAAQPLLAPPPRVWQAISAEVGFTGSAPVAASASPADHLDDAPALAPLAATPAGPRAGAHRVARGSRRRRFTLAIALAGTVAVAAVVAGVWVAQDAGIQSPTIVAEATLDAFPDHEGAQGEALLEDVDGRTQVVVTLDASVPDDGHREVWLIAADGSDLVSLGVLDGSEGTFEVPAGVDLDRFTLVDVSQEADDGDPAHSGDSIVRGALEPA
ncbi:MULTISPECIES: anti-sigma factor [unclassified Microbacterium]|uniref:anti-sigma factor n=1 Tax=unclassified Microbacterium TaxID=2609290 RepID=UPI00214C2D2F|nr:MULTISPECIES: anti-sigma factor [unclassified Microbacterium]MCR2784548.1 anti-sigma factor [Microbacterium sp. zg.B96]WIM14642.1 anti-sigma factor [Microbacterium sp. zg-B96]